VSELVYLIEVILFPRKSGWLGKLPIVIVYTTWIQTSNITRYGGPLDL